MFKHQKSEGIGQDIVDLIAKPPQVREFILEPWLQQGDLVLLYAPTGMGKSFFCQDLLHSITCDLPFLDWRPRRPRRSVYLESEMGENITQKRFADLERSRPERFTYYAVEVLSFEDFENFQLANISDPEEQKEYIQYFREWEADVVVIDNYLTAARAITKFDSDLTIWARVQEWLIALRALGLTVILVHHSGKSGEQLGTSMRENLMDTVIKLQPTKLGRSLPINGFACELHFTKARKFFGRAKEPKYLEFVTENGMSRWNHSPLSSQFELKTLSLRSQGHSFSDISRRLERPIEEIREVLRNAEADDADNLN